MKPIIFIVMLNYTIFVIKLIASFFFYGKINGIVSLIKREGGGGGGTLDFGWGERGEKMTSYVTCAMLGSFSNEESEKI